MSRRGKRGSRRLWLVLAGVGGTAVTVLLLVGVALAGLWGGGGGEDLAFMEPEMVPVSRGDIAASVTATGTLATARKLELGFSEAGEIVQLSVAPGDTVAAGQVLAVLDDRVAQLALRAAEAGFVGAQAALDGGAAPQTAEESRAAQQRVAEARVAVATAISVLEADRAVVAASSSAAATAVLQAEAAVVRATAARDTVAQQLQAAQAQQPGEPALAAARTARSTSDSDLATAQAAVVAARQQLVDAPEDPVAQARLAAAEAAVELAAAQLKRTSEALDALQAAAATTGAAAAALAEAEAALVELADALVDARDEQATTGAAGAQQQAQAQAQVASAQAAERVLVAETAAGGAAEPVQPAERAQAQVAVDTAVLEVERARRALEGLTLTAPIAGTVTAVDGAVGDMVGGGGSVDAAAGAGTDVAADSSGVLVTLTTPDVLVATLSVVEADAVQLAPGQSAELKFASLPDEVATGRVLSVEPAAAGADPFAPASYTATVAVDEVPDGARTGLKVAVRVAVESREDVLVVPAGALHEDIDGTVVFRQLPDGSTEPVTVVVGLRQGPDVEVRDGLSEGDMVEVTPPMSMEDGGGMFLG